VHELSNLIRRSPVGAIAATAILVAACGGSGTTTAPTTAATQAPPSTAPSTAPTTAASPEASEEAEAYEVELGDTDALGKFLTGEDGKTLYLFTPDTATTSACNAGCIDSWPAFTIEADETVKGGDGVTGTFTTIMRQDGAKQVAYNGHPLYYYAADKAAGDTNGQALFGKWYVVGADGKAIMGGAKATTGGGKYGY
jgi:predicted lipoprotein with Yx(FWY)xxD motif